MATVLFPIADAIIFQLLRADLNKIGANGLIWSEQKVVALAVKPAILAYDYASRSTIAQTTPQHGVVDRFGEKLPVVRMSGTFGVQPRISGITMKDGYTRLLEFRDEIFRISQQARQTVSDDKSAQYVYVVNYFDFIYNQMFCINLDTFHIETDARRNPFEPTYQLAFTGLGDYINVQTSDPQLEIFLETADLLNAAFTALDSINTSIGNSPVAQIAGITLATLAEAGTLTTEINSLISRYGSAIAGGINATKLAINGTTINAATQTPQQATKAIWSAIKS